NSSQATLEADEPLHCGVIGGASYWFRVQALNDGIMTVTTDGSDFNTLLSIYTWDGISLSGLRLEGCDDNSGTDGEDSLVRIVATAGAFYNISVDGVNGAVGTVM